jgi:hypothetical protein
MCLLSRGQSDYFSGIFCSQVDKSTRRIARVRVSRYDLRLMSLNAQQKDALSFQLAELLNCDEPRAFMATLHRIAERQAFIEARHDRFGDALSWQVIADSVARVRVSLRKSQSSRNRPNASA